MSVGYQKPEFVNTAPPIGGPIAAGPTIEPIAPTMTRSSDPSQTSSPPDFVIVGPLRAGTTMLRLMLHHHPDLALVGEFEESVAMLPDAGFPDARHYRDWLATQRVVQTRAYEIPESLNDYPAIANAMWDQLAAKHDDARLLGCTIHSRIDRILDLWPDIRFICLLRDPRDVCRSCVGMGWYGHPADATPDWLNPIRRWEQTRAKLPDDRWAEVRYEDLLREPEKVLTRCTDLLGVQYHPDMLAFHESSSYEKLDPKLAEQWKRKMTPRCAEIIDARCLPLMQTYGYQPSVPSPRDAGALERLRIKLASKLGRFRWRMNRYGLGLVLSWAIAKRLPITNAWRVRVRTRINDIDRTHLR